MRCSFSGKGVVNIFYKIHSSGNNSVLAACDKELLGITLEYGNVCFEIKESFYKGESTDEVELRELLNQFDNINLVGKKVVSVALKENLIGEKNIIKIKNIPHVQIFKI